MSQIMIVAVPPQLGGVIDQSALSNKLAAYSATVDNSQVLKNERAQRIAFNVWVRDAEGSVPLIVEMEEITKRLGWHCVISLLEGELTRLSAKPPMKINPDLL